MSGIAVAGAGAFGTALALALSGTREVILWGRDEPAMARLAEARVNPRLPGVILPLALGIGPVAQRFLKDDAAARVMVIDRTGGAEGDAIAARLTLEGDRPIDLRPGAFVDIPARRRHRVEWTDPTRPTIWLAIHHEAGSGAGA